MSYPVSGGPAPREAEKALAYLREFIEYAPGKAPHPQREKAEAWLNVLARAVASPSRGTPSEAEVDVALLRYHTAYREALAAGAEDYTSSGIGVSGAHAAGIRALLRAAALAALPHDDTRNVIQATEERYNVGVRAASGSGTPDVERIIAEECSFADEADAVRRCAPKIIAAVRRTALAPQEGA